MSTAAQEMLAKGRPYGTRPSWELRNIVRALGMMWWMNSDEENRRLDAVKRELKIRSKMRRGRL